LLKIDEKTLITK